MLCGLKIAKLVAARSSVKHVARLEGAVKAFSAGRRERCVERGLPLEWRCLP